jgi:hypothetical protein
MLTAEIMKRVFQIVALAVAVLLTAQPALADPSCKQGMFSSDCAAEACCTHMAGAAMHETSADCNAAMLSAAASSGCNHDGGCFASSWPVPSIAPAAKSRINVTASSTPIASFSMVSISGLVARPFRNPEAPEPAKYILLRVFRI